MKLSFKGCLLAAAIFLILPSCSGSGSKSASDADSAAAASLHADNDIAMILRSLIDALNVEQALDSNIYNFRGTLTDGSGRPLYTDVQGSPGAWEVRVINDSSAALRNIYLGDLLTEELQQYLLTTLHIPDSTLVAGGPAGHDPDANLRIYDFGKGELIFETKEAETEGGESGPLLNIIVRKRAGSSKTP